MSAHISNVRPKPDQVLVVVEALRRAGPDPSREAFIRGMESLTGWDAGLGIPFQLSPVNHLAHHRVWLTRTEGGRWISVEDEGP